MSNIRRYIRLYLHFLRFSISKALEFRVDFTFRIFMDIVFYIVQITFFKVIFLHTNLLGGFSEAQSMVFIVSYLLANSVMMTFLGNNIWWFPYFVNGGDLDYYLVRPVSTKFFLGLRDIAANSFLNVITAIGLLIWAVAGYKEELGTSIPIENYIFYFLFLINGIFLYFLVRMTMILPVFWTQAGRGFDEIFFNLQVIMQRPDGIYTGFFRSLVTTMLPLTLMVSFPVRILFEGPSWELIAPIIGVTLLFVLIFNFIWKRAFLSYSSASS